MHEAQEKKSAGTVRQTESVPAEVPSGGNAIPAPRGVWWRAGRNIRHRGEHGGPASFGGLCLMRFDLNDNPVVCLDADGFATTQTREQFPIVHDALAKRGLRDAVRLAMALDAVDYGLMRDHDPQSDGQKPICQWAITHVIFDDVMGNIPA